MTAMRADTATDRGHKYPALEEAQPSLRIDIVAPSPRSGTYGRATSTANPLLYFDKLLSKNIPQQRRWPGALVTTLRDVNIKPVPPSGGLADYPPAETRKTVDTQPFTAAIDAAKAILSWEENWDDEGSPAYAQTTLDRARRFLLVGVRKLWHGNRLTIGVPRVWAGPDGSVDMRWEGGGRYALVNIPAERDRPITLYATDADGEMNHDIRQDQQALWFFAWLARP